MQGPIVTFPLVGNDNSFDNAICFQQCPVSFDSEIRYNVDLQTLKQLVFFTDHRSQATGAGHRSQLQATGHCFNNTESVLNIRKLKLTVTSYECLGYFL